MNRNRFLKNFLGLSLFTIWGCQPESSESNNAKFASTAGGSALHPNEKESTKQLRKDLKAAWLRSEEMTLKNVDQMPPEYFTFKYTDEAMTFAEQWRHCVIYTCGQFAKGAGTVNPYKKVKLPVQMPKESVIEELKNMYAFMREQIEKLSEDKLYSKCRFAGDIIPVWRLFYALENHIIHHRGQCVVYLRLNGVTPKGFYGW